MHFEQKIEMNQFHHAGTGPAPNSVIHLGIYLYIDHIIYHD